MKIFILYILYYDILYYFLHRLLHTKYFYYNIHKIHHKKFNIKYYDYYTIHILEFPLTSVGLLLAIYLYKLYIYQLLFSIIFINIR